MIQVPSEDELAAIAAAYLLLQREQPPPVPAVSRWTLAARAFARDEPQPASWRGASRLR